MSDLTQPIISMTVGDLKAFILEVVHEDQQLQGRREGLEGEALMALLDEMWEHVIIPPAGTPSSLELLREDRNHRPL
jgi:hypothetical protein